MNAINILDQSSLDDSQEGSFFILLHQYLLNFGYIYIYITEILNICIRTTRFGLEQKMKVTFLTRVAGSLTVGSGASLSPSSLC